MFNRTKDKVVTLSYIIDDHALLLSLSLSLYIYIYIYIYLFIYIYIVLIFTHLSKDVLSIRTKHHTFGSRKINRMIDSLYPEKIGFLRNPQKRFRRLEKASEFVQMLKTQVFKSVHDIFQ